MDLINMDRSIFDCSDKDSSSFFRCWWRGLFFSPSTPSCGNALAKLMAYSQECWLTTLRTILREVRKGGDDGRLLLARSKGNKKKYFKRNPSRSILRLLTSSAIGEVMNCYSGRIVTWPDRFLYFLFHSGSPFQAKHLYRRP